jgi:amidohydrolase
MEPVTMQPDASALARVRREVRDLAPEIVRLRRDFHQHPEGGFRETRTAEKIAAWLRECGPYRVRTGVAKTGVIADLEGRDPAGPCVLLRADMDALKANEENAHLAFRSVNPGLMHACGHDGHMAILLGAARVLARHRDAIKGRVRLVFQPAEEGPGGAEPMIAEGALRDPVPDAAFALHLWSRLPLGVAGVRAGPMMAYTDEIVIRVRGRGGHGAHPDQGIDAILAACQLVVALQTIVSRSVDPTESAVLSVGKISGGTVMNALAEEVVIEGTQRAFRPEIRDLCTRRVHEIAAGIDTAFGSRTGIEYIARYPAMVNDPERVKLATGILEGVLGAGRVIDIVSLGGEDMAFYLQQVPGCLFFLGAGNPVKGCDAPHHSPRFDIDEDALPIGAELLLRLTEHFVGALD